MSVRQYIARNISLRKSAVPLGNLPVIDRKREISGGRCIHDGYQRGWGLEFAGLEAQVARDPLFRRALSAARDDENTRTVVKFEKLANIFLILRYFFGELDSQNIIEFGSYRGGSALFMAVILAEMYPKAKVYALDTFEGMPETDHSKDLHNAGDFRDTSMDAIHAAIGRLGLKNLELVKGLVEDTAIDTYKAVGSFGLAHLDLDIYPALKYSQDSVWPYMTKGGYLIYDDATFSSCIGATQAAEELIIERNIHTEQVYPHFVFRTGL
jgi:predicted O-methyltransferase YrrM